MNDVVVVALIKGAALRALAQQTRQLRALLLDLHRATQGLIMRNLGQVENMLFQIAGTHTLSAWWTHSYLVQA